MGPAVVQDGGQAVCVPQHTHVSAWSDAGSRLHFSLQGIIRHLKQVLHKHPPPAPTEPAVRLVEAVGKLQVRHS